jgi:hypothetical protein
MLWTREKATPSPAPNQIAPYGFKKGEQIIPPFTKEVRGGRNDEL